MFGRIDESLLICSMANIIASVWPRPKANSFQQLSFEFLLCNTLRAPRITSPSLKAFSFFEWTVSWMHKHKTTKVKIIVKRNQRRTLVRSLWSLCQSVLSRAWLFLTRIALLWNNQLLIFHSKILVCWIFCLVCQAISMATFLNKELNFKKGSSFPVEGYINWRLYWFYIFKTRHGNPCHFSVWQHPIIYVLISTYSISLKRTEAFWRFCCVSKKTKMKKGSSFPVEGFINWKFYWLIFKTRQGNPCHFSVLQHPIIYVLIKYALDIA